jgi:hypothetical protein
MSRRLKKNLKVFALLALSIVLGTSTSEAIHQWLDSRGNDTIRHEAAQEPSRTRIEQAVTLNQVPKN